VRHVEENPSAAQVESAISGLLADASERTRLRAAALAHAETHSFEVAAEGLHAAVAELSAVS